ncbi:lytic transglycosylase domain-containing protein [Crassaminicella profunda]|nr:lytic transglycosylase domain-containing protein [Crassaminicella profunda]QZY57461.1 lytic transglycosylase domain-containing protein [Crassaminicella profunda]
MIIVMSIGVALTNTNWLLKILYPMHYGDIIEKYAKEYKLDPYLIAAIIRTESKFDEKAKSNKNARGLMQISEVTGKWASEELSIDNYNEEILFIPDTNIKIGCWYIDKLREEFDDHLQLMIAAYNGGSGNVNKWLKDPKYSDDGEFLKDIPFPETKAYVKKVIKSYKVYKIIYR